MTLHDGSIGRGLRAVDQWIDSLRRVPVAKLPFSARPDRPESAGILHFMPHFTLFLHPHHTLKGIVTGCSIDLYHS